MITTHTKWGNSLAISFPYVFIKVSNFNENENIEFTFENGLIILGPVKKQKKENDYGGTHQRHDAERCFRPI